MLLRCQPSQAAPSSSQGLMELRLVLPSPDTDEKSGLGLLRRLWVVKFDKEDEIRKLAER